MIITRGKVRKPMRILIACEYSGKVRDAFIEKGHHAVSCDIIASTSNKGEHLQGDVTQFLDMGWDMMIGFPPCTHLAVSGARHFAQKIKDGRQQQGLDFFRTLMEAPIPMIALENPVGIVSNKILKPTQIIQPYQFGDPVKKTTCLWLKNMNPLVPTHNVEDQCQYTEYVKSDGKIARFSTWFLGKNGHERSETFDGIAQAMADQWGWIP